MKKTKSKKKADSPYTTKAEFETFRKEFLAWVVRLGLQGYDIQAFHIPLEESEWASISIDTSQSSATVSLNSSRNVDFDPYEAAHHEVIHLLLGRIVGLAKERFISEESLQNAEEEVVNRLAVLMQPITKIPRRKGIAKKESRNI